MNPPKQPRMHVEAAGGVRHRPDLFTRQIRSVVDAPTLQALMRLRLRLVREGPFRPRMAGLLWARRMAGLVADRVRF